MTHCDWSLFYFLILDLNDCNSHWKFNLLDHQGWKLFLPPGPRAGNFFIVEIKRLSTGPEIKTAHVDFEIKQSRWWVSNTKVPSSGLIWPSRSWKKSKICSWFSLDFQLVKSNLFRMLQNSAVQIIFLTNLRVQINSHVMSLQMILRTNQSWKSQVNFLVQ